MSTTTCRFWLARACRNGAGCRFSHEGDQRRRGEPEGVDLKAEAKALNIRTTELNWFLGLLLLSWYGEQEMRQFLILSPDESGRGIDLPAERYMRIEHEAPARGFTVQGAFSLRRQLLREMALHRRQNFYLRLDMGDPTQANRHAARFERLVEQYLERLGLPYLTEEDIRVRGSKNTPDFLLLGKRIIINGVAIRWIDCKTYFGASILATNNKLPIGKLLQQTERYNRAFCSQGETGAIIFLCGFSAHLRDTLASITHPSQHGTLPILLNAHCLDTTQIWAEQNEG